MARRKKNFIVVAIKGDKLVADEFGDDVEGASDVLLAYEDGQALLLDGLVVPFRVKREPTIVIGGATAAPTPSRKRGARAKKPKAPTNGAPSPKGAPDEPSLDVEA
jgi:hypothetical protein